MEVGIGIEGSSPNSKRSRAFQITYANLWNPPSKCIGLPAKQIVADSSGRALGGLGIPGEHETRMAGVCTVLSLRPLSGSRAPADVAPPGGPAAASRASGSMSRLPTPRAGLHLLILGVGSSGNLCLSFLFLSFPIYPYIYLFCLSICVFIRLSVHLTIYISVYSGYSCIYPSICPFN